MTGVALVIICWVLFWSAYYLTNLPDGLTKGRGKEEEKKNV